ANFNASSSVAIRVVVNNAASLTTVTSTVNPTVFGQSTTFSVTVAAVAPGAGTPTGTVTFLDGGVSFGTGTLSGGTASIAKSNLTDRKSLVSGEERTDGNVTP